MDGGKGLPADQATLEDRADSRTRPDQDRTSPDRMAPDAGEQDRQDEHADPEEERRSRRRRRLVLLGALIVGVLVTIGGILYWRYARQFESTDDAFVTGRITEMAPQVSGRVAQLLIDDNQHVEQGQLLIEIDPRDYQVRLQQAEAERGNAAAQVRQASAQLELQQASLGQAEANVRVAESERVQAQQDYDRYRSVDQRAVTRQQVDNALAALRTATARLDASRQMVDGARAQADAARAQITAAEAQLRQAEANVENAKLQLSYTRITAPTSGRIARRTVEVGNYVAPGQAMFALVQDEFWVTANFKETQLSHMRPGQKVDIDIDAFPDVTFGGHVDSMQRGTGAVFSALPAENATGNYVKVVQRVPVKIVFDDARARDFPLAPGMSVVPTVTVR